MVMPILKPVKIHSSCATFLCDMASNPVTRLTQKNLLAVMISLQIIHEYFWRAESGKLQLGCKSFAGKSAASSTMAAS